MNVNEQELKLHSVKRGKPGCLPKKTDSTISGDAAAFAEVRQITEEEIKNAVKNLFLKANLQLPEDVAAALKKAGETESWPAAAGELELLEKNLEAAAEKCLPICQDTGAACVFAKIGTDLHICGDFNRAVNEGVKEAYAEGYFRNSIAADPILRGNTGDNTPAFITVELTTGDSLELTALPKGFGSENMSAVSMMNPTAGAEGIIDFVLDTVKKAGPNPCPPIVVGIGLGGTFDKAALLSKKALLRSLAESNPNPFYAELEQTLMERINALGIGPQGFGGNSTCIGVAVEQLPTHVAGLPVAVNISCHALRRASCVL